MAHYAVELVTGLGSTHVFTLTGGMAMHLNRAVAEHPTLKPVYCQHEQACVASAEGYAKASNFRRAGFAVVTAGPGVSNTVTSLISAFGDSTPLIVLAGQIKTADIDCFGTRTHGIQEIRSQELIAPCVKAFVRLDADNFRKQLREACITAFSDRPGPVFIEIPLDVQGMPVGVSATEISDAVKEVNLQLLESSKRSFQQQTQLKQAFEALLQAKRPLIYIGNGVRISGQEAVAQAFSEKHKIPLVFSWLSFDIVHADHPLNFGCPGGLAPIYSNQILNDADVIVFLGARLDLGTTAFQRDTFGKNAQRWIIDIDPAELTKFKGLANTHCVLSDLRLLARTFESLGAMESSATKNWLPRIAELRSAYRLEEGERLSNDKFSVYCIARLLSSISSGKLFVSASSGYAEETFTRFFAPKPGARFFNGAALGAMGMGLPNAIGAAFGASAQVICVEADGGLMLNIQELATLSQYAPPGFVLFVLNNNGYESIRSSQKRHFGSVYGADSESGVFIPNFKDLAAAFKIDYISINDQQQLQSFLQTLKSDGSPIIVDLHVEKFEYRGPSVKTIMDAKGRPSTTALGDIDW